MPDVSDETRRVFLRLFVGVGLFGLGVVVGLALGPPSDEVQDQEIARLKAALAQARAEAEALKVVERYPAQGAEGPFGGGALKPADRARHEKEGARYTAALRREDAQAAAELIEWFIQRWNMLLDTPRPGDRKGRRAATLLALVQGMSKVIHPEDFVAWQAEFFGARWLGEIYRDLDGDGLPAPRASLNRKDGFTNASVCEMAMVLNQSLQDARVLLMPTAPCERKLSLFLGGRTYNDALNEFVRALRREGYLVVEQRQKGSRLLLVGPQSAG